MLEGRPLYRTPGRGRSRKFRGGIHFGPSLALWTPLPRFVLATYGILDCQILHRATAYRYFKNTDALLLEAPLDAAVGRPEGMFTGDSSTDPEQRIEAAEAALHELSYCNEAQLRLLLANSIARDPGSTALPKRRNRRTPLIEAALATSRQRFTDANHRKLCAALALVMGTESMIVCQDVLVSMRRRRGR